MKNEEKTYYFKVKYKQFTFIRTAKGIIRKLSVIELLKAKGYYKTDLRRLQIASIKCFWEIDKPTNYGKEKSTFVSSYEYSKLLDNIHARILKVENL